MALNLTDVRYELIQQLVVIVVLMKFSSYKQRLLLSNKRLRSYSYVVLAHQENENTFLCFLIHGLKIYLELIQ